MAWQSAMGIDGLERGARQPFYSSWRADTQGSHYVAEVRRQHSVCASALTRPP
jgi:hypothetical protein